MDFIVFATAPPHSRMKSWYIARRPACRAAAPKGIHHARTVVSAREDTVIIVSIFPLLLLLHWNAHIVMEAAAIER
jgi:hypothetical protein